jgi:hypothetical protein
MAVRVGAGLIDSAPGLGVHVTGWGVGVVPVEEYEPGAAFPRVTGRTADGSSPAWPRLYHVATDPAENHNLAGQHRDKLIELIAMWYAEAGKCNVPPSTAAPTNGSWSSGRRSPSRGLSTAATGHAK